MKTRRSLVSNSSTSSFIVRYKDRMEDKEKVFLTDEEISYLKQIGFHLTACYNLDDISRDWYNDDWVLSETESDEYMLLSFGCFVVCNQDEIILRLLQKNIPFIASCHYGHETIIYPKDSKLFIRLANPGRKAETYLRYDTVEKIKEDLEQCLKTPAQLVNVEEYIKEEMGFWDKDENSTVLGE